MKKLRFFLVSFAAFALTFTGCKDTKEPVPGDTTGTKVTLAEIVDAAFSTYKSWEEGEGLTDSFKVGSKDFNAPEYQFAICQALVNISKGEKGDITVPSYKPAAHPERDSYDKETIAVTNGPKNGEETEDLVNVASRRSPFLIFACPPTGRMSAPSARSVKRRRSRPRSKRR